MNLLTNFFFARGRRATFSIIFPAIAVVILTMWLAGTLSYPWIMIDRQVQLLTRCEWQKETSFPAKPFHFTIVTPTDLCILPHRIFPEDTTVQIVPRRYYSVWNEYAKGTIVEASRATFLFEPLTSERNAGRIADALSAGGFLRVASTTQYTTPNGFSVIEVHNALGIEDGKLFDWAFIDHPDGQSTLSILSTHTEDQTVFHKLIEALRIGDE